MTSYPQANLPPREPATQTHQPTFSACFPACSPAARATDSPGPPQSNRGRDPTRITSLVTYLKTYVVALLFHLSPSNDPPLTSFSPSFATASTARGREASPVVDLARLGMRCRARLYYRQRAWPRRWRIRGESTRGHSGCKGQERGGRLLRVGRPAESGGALLGLFSMTPF